MKEKEDKRSMDRMFKSFQPPAYEEGFNEINIITWGGDKTTLEDILDRNEIPHDNHHHTLNCRAHCIAADLWLLCGCEIEEKEGE